MQDKYSSKNIKRTVRASMLLGIGIIAALDEIVFHQILAWHHFYDQDTQPFALFSDGILHAFELVAIVSGFFLLLDLQRKRQINYRSAMAGFYLGAGMFQLFDGIVIHKILKLHQIRYVENLWAYDLMWNIFGLVLLITGLFVYRNAKSASVI